MSVSRRERLDVHSDYSRHDSESIRNSMNERRATVREHIVYSVSDVTHSAE